MHRRDVEFLRRDDAGQPSRARARGRRGSDDEMDDVSASALARLVAFLRSELAAELPAALRRRYADALAEADLAIAADDPAPLDELGLDPRTLTFLKRAGFATVGALARADPADLAAVPYMGPGRLLKVRQALDARAARGA